MQKNYVIAPYESGEYKTLAMYKKDDFRVSSISNKITGVYEKTPVVKGTQNGREVGIFHGDNHKDYLVFSDYSAVEMPYIERRNYSILLDGKPTVVTFLGRENGDNVFEIVGTTKLVFKKIY